MVAYIHCPRLTAVVDSGLSLHLRISWSTTAPVQLHRIWIFSFFRLNSSIPNQLYYSRPIWFMPRVPKCHHPCLFWWRDIWLLFVKTELIVALQGAVVYLPLFGRRWGVSYLRSDNSVSIKLFRWCWLQLWRSSCDNYYTKSSQNYSKRWRIKTVSDGQSRFILCHHIDIRTFDVTTAGKYQTCCS